ncbi:MAG: hypothetical protein HY400_00260 [Elusimicrobia bacterium]|nr:hypothetical protein [Elusimicrobiota bacterium]
MTKAQLLPGETLPILKHVVIEVEVQLSTGGIFLYSYKIFNSISNTGKIKRIEVDIFREPQSVKLGLEGLTNDASFVEGIPVDGSLVVPVAFHAPDPEKWISGFTTKLTARWSAVESQAQIAPGKVLGGFTLQSRGIPGIRSMALHPLFEQTPVEEATAEDVARIRSIADQIKLTTSTIGPIAPRSLEPSTLIDNLISLKHQSVSLGWIFGPGVDGIVKSLNAKLEAAKAAVKRNQDKTAINQLKAFIKELEALRGKKLNDNAYFLLKVNAEFIVAKLES